MKAIIKKSMTILITIKLTTLVNYSQHNHNTNENKIINFISTIYQKNYLKTK